MNSSHKEIPIEELENREKLYEYYYSLVEEIKGEPIKLSSEEYEENLLTAKIGTILNYIKQIVPILINKKIEDYQKIVSFNQSNIHIRNVKNINDKNNINDIIYQYENQLRYYESQLRFYLKKILIYKIQKESMKSKIKLYMEMEEEFEVLKEKLKYDNGQFLNNDRKENEIEILRRENSNLKKAISKLEEEKKLSDTKRKKDKDIISELKNQIENLTQKVNKLEENQKEITANSNNSSINININNNGKRTSKWIIKQDYDSNSISKKQENSICYKKKKIIKSNFDKRKGNIGLIENITFSPCNHRILNKCNKKTLSPSKYLQHHKTNSLKEERKKKIKMMTKYFSCNSSNSDFSKISNLIPNAKLYITKQNNSKQIFSSLSRLYMLGSKSSKNINKSSLNIIRSNSSELK